MSKFQFVLISIFIAFIIIGVTLFATYKGNQVNQQLPPITVWGTVPSEIFNRFTSSLSTTLGLNVAINYREFREDSFNTAFIEALASGEGPDSVLLPQDMVLRHEDKIIKVPYEALSERNFKDIYIRTAENYLTSTGILALPLSIDPVVMYWNRDTFTNALIPTYPKYWDELTSLIPKLTKRDSNLNIRNTAIALGEFRNVKNAREIFGTLLLQSGNNVVERGVGQNTGEVISSVLDDSVSGVRPTEQALEFFTRFADPGHPDYSWNRGLSSSDASFLSGALATYFGFASEINSLRERNPNIDYDVAPIPQARGSQNRVTFGRMHGISIVRSTQNPAIAFAVMEVLTSKDALSLWTELTYLPPVRRDVINQGTKDPYLQIFYDSALIADSWLDPDKFESGQIFQNMVESVTSGKSTISNSVTTADRLLQDLINRVRK